MVWEKAGWVLTLPRSSRSHPYLHLPLGLVFWPPFICCRPWLLTFTLICSSPSPVQYLHFSSSLGLSMICRSLSPLVWSLLFLSWSLDPSDSLLIGVLLVCLVVYASLLPQIRSTLTGGHVLAVFGQLLRSPWKGSVGADSVQWQLCCVPHHLTHSLPFYKLLFRWHTIFFTGFYHYGNEYLLFKSKINIVSRIVLLFRIRLRWKGSKWFMSLSFLNGSDLVLHLSRGASNLFLLYRTAEAKARD